MIVVVDNRDSFTFNLVQELQRLGAVTVVVRSDRATAEELLALGPNGLLVGPGPGEPAGAGCTEALVRASLAADLPLLGICLGHQALATALGGRLRRASELVHGATRAIEHDGSGILSGLASPFEMARYNSLVVDENHLPEGLIVNARTADGDVAGLRHRSRRAFGLQGHPESILCVEGGREVLRTFLCVVTGGC